MIAPDAVERYLDRASALIETVLWGVGRTLGVVEAARRRRVARLLIESSTMPAAMFDKAGEIELANPAWRSLFGDVGPDARFASHVEAVLGSCEVQHVPELAIDPAHRLAYCAATVRATRGSLGATTGAIVVCEVITDHVVARQLGVATDAPICSGWLGREADYHNAAWVACVGQVAAWQDAIHTSDRDRCLRALADGRRSTKTETEARIRCRSEERWHHLTLTCSETRWFIVAVDVHTQRTASEERAELLATALAARADAELANRRKDQFLATVSHELRAPVTTMLLWDKVLRDAASDAPLRAQALDAIHESAVAQGRLVGDLLDIARAISGKLHVDLRAIDVERITAEALSAIESIAAARGLTIVAPRNPSGIALVQGDAFRVRQILDNLLSNAVKFSDRGATVSVIITSTRRFVTIAVSDTGRGISAAFLQRIFEPFSQSEDGLSRSGAGLGLGLAISKQLVELQGGSLTVASPGLGLGSTFTITLPTAGRASSPVVTPHTPTLAPHRILIVDDDRRVLDALSVLLERVGAQVVTADSAEGARQIIAAAEPDAVLCDIAMPGEDGYTFIKRLRGSGVTAPAIALTAHAMEADAARALAAGFDAHLAKPIDFERLVAKIAQLIATSV